MSEGQLSVEQEARAMGWVPKEEFRGGDEHWVDPDTFVKRGREIMPMLRRNNQELIAKNQRLETEMKSLREVVTASQESIAALKEFHDEDTRRQVARAKDALLAELKQAKTDNNVEREVELTDELTRLNAAQVQDKKLQEDEKKTSSTSVSVEEQLDPAYIDFASRNTWFGKDIRKTNKAMGIAQMIRADEAYDNLTGAEFFAEVERRLNGDAPRGQSKVEGARTSGGSGAGSGRKTYADLPPDAKEACSRQGKKLVGEGRAYKTEAEWQKRYAELYFQGEE